jgi:hypothetical protein
MEIAQLCCGIYERVDRIFSSFEVSLYLQVMTFLYFLYCLMMALS